jgi:hypothetical protein
MAQVNAMALMPDQPTAQKYEPSGSRPPLPDYPSSLFHSTDPISMPSRLPTHWQDTDLINLSDSIPFHVPAMPDGNPFTSLLGFPSSREPSLSRFPHSQSSIQEVPIPLLWLPPHISGRTATTQEHADALRIIGLHVPHLHCPAIQGGQPSENLTASTQTTTLPAGLPHRFIPTLPDPINQGHHRPSLPPNM